MADFIADTTARIRARNLRAEPVLAELTGLRRFVAKSSLAIGNAIDRFGGVMSDGTAAFASGAVFGAVRGTILGSVLFMGVTVLLPFTGLAAPLALVAFAGTLIHDAAHSYNAMKKDDPRYDSSKRADWLATRGGAINDATSSHPNKDHAFYNAVRDKNAEDKTAMRLHRTTDLESKLNLNQPGGIPSAESSSTHFVDAEMKRREAQQFGPKGRA